MNSAYLFVHFREISTPEGEQMRFGLSLDGLNWEEINGGHPVMWAYYGEKGVRDFTITRSEIDGNFYVLATDLCLAYSMRQHRDRFWEYISRNGSKCLSMWKSPDLVNWSEQQLVTIGNDDYGCIWAPDIIYDREAGDYIVHYTASRRSDDYTSKAIMYSRTKDFVNFTVPEYLLGEEKCDFIDSAIYEEDGKYYMFVKGPGRVMLYNSDSITGKYERIEAFDPISHDEAWKYEAPTAVKLADGRWCLFLDFFGASGAGQGYVPFVSDSIAFRNFVRSEENFSFPYRFKHGTILKITREEYDRIKAHDWGRIVGW